MPYPQNLQTAIKVENIVKEQGCVPATIAIIDGIIKVGLSILDMEVLAKKGLDAHKTSRRDLALVISKKLTGSTTVSGTMILAHKAGIKFFVTGGIGGVHRGAEESFDISADLTELGRTPMAVICSGAKSILDIEKTLEFLETQGVCVVTYGKNNDFPAFYTTKSGLKSMMALKTPQECADLIHSNTCLKIDSGVVIAVPIPDAEALDSDYMNSMIQSSIDDLKSQNIKGREVTPYLLSKMKSLTDGKSLRANIALIENNALVGSRIAKSYSSKNSNSDIKRPIIIGVSALDVSAKLSTDSPIHATSNFGSIRYSIGGVGRNIAEASFKTMGNPRFISIVGTDFAGDGILKEMKSLNMDTNDISQSKSATASYSAILTSKGELITAVADMKILEELNIENCLQNASVICCDGNVPLRILNESHEYSIKNNIPYIIEPTSVPKSIYIMNAFEKISSTNIIITPNYLEALAMAETLNLRGLGMVDFPSAIKKQLLVHKLDIDLEKLQNSAKKLMQKFKIMILKLGPLGVLIGERATINSRLSDEYHSFDEGLSWTYIPSSKVLQSVVSVTGAGDSMVGALVTQFSKFPELHGHDLEETVRKCMRASILSLKSTRAISENLTSDIFNDH